MLIQILLVLLSSKLGSCSDFCPLPYESTGKTVEIELIFRLYSLIEFQDVAGNLDISGAIVAMWHDPCGWNLASKLFPFRTANLSTAVVDLDYFKLPILTQDATEHVNVFESTGEMPMEVYDSGYVAYWGRKHWTANCFGEFTNFPFDTHTCELNFFPWDNIEFLNITKARFEILSEWYDPERLSLFSSDVGTIRNTQYEYKCGEKLCSYSWVTFPFNIYRKWFPYYFFVVFLPIFMLSLLQLSAFFIPYDEIDRIAFSASIFLSNTVMTADVMGYIPKTAEPVVVVTASNIATLVSLVAIVFFVLSYFYKDKYPRKKMIYVQIGATVFFTVFYIVLLASTVLLVCL